MAKARQKSLSEPVEQHTPNRDDSCYQKALEGAPKTIIPADRRDCSKTDSSEIGAQASVPEQKDAY
jgi:hypothetical protein